MFQDNYRECFVVAKIKKVEEEYMLDLPFPTTSYCIIYNDSCWYANIPKVDGADVLAHITYFASDDDIVKSFEGYIGDNSTSEGRIAIQTHPRFEEFWIEKREEIRDEDGELIGYGGTVYPCVFITPTYRDE